MNELSFYKKILALGKIKFTVSNLEKCILEDPNSNNFLGIISILKNYNIACSPFIVEDNKLPLEKLPFITHKKNPEEIVIIDNVENEIISCTSNNGKKYKIKINDFEKEWSRNIIFLDYEKAFEKKYLKNFFVENSRNILFIFILLISICSIGIKFYFPFNLLYLINNLIGLFICFKLFSISVSQSQEGSKICSISQKSNCLSVLNHKSSKLFGLISYDKIGFVYFTFALLLPVFLNSNYLFFLFYLFTISALFPLYSIYFQYYVIKSWCPLCLIIQINLVANFVILYLCKISFIYSIESIFVSASILVIIIIVTIIFTMNNDLENSNRLFRNRLNLFINDSEILENLQNRNVKFLSIPNSRSIVTGNLSSTNKITFITNPFCKYCSEKYESLKEIIEYNDNIKIETIYCITNDLEIIKTITYKLIEIYFVKGANEYLYAIEEWYSSGYSNYVEWLNKFSSTNEMDDSFINEVIEVHREWCKLSLIDATPTILLNDKILSPEYQVEDLKYIL